MTRRQLFATFAAALGRPLGKFTLRLRRFIHDADMVWQRAEMHAISGIHPALFGGGPQYPTWRQTAQARNSALCPFCAADHKVFFVGGIPSMACEKAPDKQDVFIFAAPTAKGQVVST